MPLHVNFKPHQLYFCHCALDYTKFKMTYRYNLIKFRKTLIFMKYIATNGHILIAFRKPNTKQIVYLVNLKPGRKNIFVIANLFGYVLLTIMFILNIAEDLLHNIFK